MTPRLLRLILLTAFSLALTVSVKSQINQIDQLLEIYKMDSSQLIKYCNSNNYKKISHIVRLENETFRIEINSLTGEYFDMIFGNDTTCNCKTLAYRFINRSDFVSIDSSLFKNGFVRKKIKQFNNPDYKTDKRFSDGKLLIELIKINNKFPYWVTISPECKYFSK